MKKIAITGLSGVLGSYISDQLTPNYTIIDLYHAHPTSLHPQVEGVFLDLLDTKTITSVLSRIKADHIIHLAAVTHIDACENDKKNGQEGKVWRINVEATKAITQFAASQGTHLIFMSTESVFDGQKSEYLENDTPNPLSWYGQSKAEAEALMTNSPAESCIIRAVIAYHTDPKKKTIFSSLLHQFSQKKPFPVVNDQWITPTFIPDVAQAIEKIIADRKQGIFHIAPSEKTTPYQFALTMAEKLGYDKELIQPVTLREFLGLKRAKLRVKNACLATSYTQQELGFTFRTLSDVLTK